uniref:Uncharacterized protein n=1 Tax=Arundo donax TaxID=35708 RepID=A0A0A8ZNB6_ARUDO
MVHNHIVHLQVRTVPICYHPLQQLSRGIMAHILAQCTDQATVTL